VVVVWVCRTAAMMYSSKAGCAAGKCQTIDIISSAGPERRQDFHQGIGRHPSICEALQACPVKMAALIGSRSRYIFAGARCRRE
jgi:hypothetical protein